MLFPVDHYQQIMTRAEMQALAGAFIGQGVRFETIINYTTVWDSDG